MTSTTLQTALVVAMAERSNTMHRLMREREQIRAALTLCHLGEPPAVILARLEAEGVAIGEEGGA